jgi:hypothetical protein
MYVNTLFSRRTIAGAVELSELPLSKLPLFGLDCTCLQICVFDYISAGACFIIGLWAVV